MEPNVKQNKTRPPAADKNLVERTHVPAARQPWKCVRGPMMNPSSHHSRDGRVCRVHDALLSGVSDDEPLHLRRGWPAAMATQQSSLPQLPPINFVVVFASFCIFILSSTIVVVVVIFGDSAIENIHFFNKQQQFDSPVFELRCRCQRIECCKSKHTDM